VVETPAAAVLVTMPIVGVQLAQLSINPNVQLALRSGMANSLRVLVTDVLINSMVTLHRRRLGTAAVGVTVEFEITLVQIDMTTNYGEGAVNEMADKVAMQEPTFDAFIKASAASLGVLDQLDQMSVDIGAITMKQETTKSLPDPKQPPLPPAQGTSGTENAAIFSCIAAAMVCMAVVWRRNQLVGWLSRCKFPGDTTIADDSTPDPATNPMHNDPPTRMIRSHSSRERAVTREHLTTERRVEHEQKLSGITDVAERQQVTQAYEKEERLVEYQHEMENIQKDKERELLAQNNAASDQQHASIPVAAPVRAPSSAVVQAINQQAQI
jgi:hypothetical protein